MDTATISLLIGCLSAGLIWWAIRAFVRRVPGEPVRERGNTQPGDDAPWEHTESVYRKLLYLRLASLCLCLLAAAVLYLRMGTVFAVLIAGAGCLLQFAAYRIRTRHVQAVRRAALAEEQKEAR